MFDTRFPLSRGTRRLFGQLQAKLPPDEQVLAAVRLMRGPRPGSEVFGSIVGAIGGLCAFLLAVFGLSTVRRYFILAVTAERAILFRGSWSGRPGEIEEDLRLSAIREINDATGDSFIDIGGRRYWITGLIDHVYRLRRVIAAHRSRERAGVQPSDAQPLRGL